MKIYQLLTIILLVFISSCKPKEEVRIKVEPTWDSLIEFSTTPDYCIQMDLPVSEFTVTYPDIMNELRPIEGTLNVDYNYLMYQDSLYYQIEAIALGSSTIPKNVYGRDMLYKQILIQARQVALRLGFELTEEFRGIDTFDGKEYNMFRAIGKVDNRLENLLGTYLILGLIVEADVNNKNGVFITMMANENSTIESFEDFATKGCVSHVWNSIKFDYKKKLPQE